MGRSRDGSRLCSPYLSFPNYRTLLAYQEAFLPETKNQKPLFFPLPLDRHKFSGYINLFQLFWREI